MNGYVNPIAVGLRILDDYRALIVESLKSNGLDGTSVDKIIERMLVENKLLLSLNKNYRMGELGFPDFCSKNNLSGRLVECFPKLIKGLRLHQEEAIQSIMSQKHTVIATGTGSGKTESFLIPIVDYCLRKTDRGIKALIIYPMNALANDQINRIDNALKGTKIKYAVFSGNTPEHYDEKENGDAIDSENFLKSRAEICKTLPDILLTNHVMLERILTGRYCSIFSESRDTLRYVVTDEIHTFRGNRAVDLKYLLLRLRHLVSRETVQIACSATLSSIDRSSYVDGKRSDLDFFIKEVLSIESYELITAREVEETYINVRPGSAEAVSKNLPTAFRPTSDLREIVSLASLLNGKKYSEFDAIAKTGSEAPIVKDIIEHEIFQEIKSSLSGEVLSVPKLAEILEEKGLIKDRGTTYSLAVVKSFLTVISFFNSKKSGKPLLDFRVHLFVKDSGGYLKKCPVCDRFFSGNQEFCDECGMPLFFVDRECIEFCLGKISGDFLSPYLFKESDDPKNTFLVRISRLPSDEGIKVRLEGDDHDRLIIKHDASSDLTLVNCQVDMHNIEDHLISLTDYNREYEYLEKIVSSIFEYQNRERKNLLCFIDNREKTSLVSSVFADDFFESLVRELLMIYYPSSGSLAMSEVDSLLARIEADLDELEPIKRSILQESFCEIRLCMMRFFMARAGEYSSRRNLLSVEYTDSMSDTEKRILEWALRERLIKKDAIQLPKDRRFVKFELRWIINRQGFYLSSRSSGSATYAGSLVLSPKNLGSDLTDSELSKALEALIKKRYILSEITEDDKQYFFLNPSKVFINRYDSECKSLNEAVDRFLITSEVHNSEVKKRKEVEERFKGGKTNVLVSTSTLEMGIDIGELDSIMMIGVPPLPSNYAQRSGRAGRRAGSFALVTTFCSESNNHDLFYFARPEEMVQGMISPPRFDPLNRSIIKKHINAFLLSGKLSRIAVVSLMKSSDSFFEERVNNEIAEIFGEAEWIEDYVLKEFRSVCRELVAKTQEDYCNGVFYSSKHAPDYGFRREAVLLADIKESPSVLKIKDHYLNDDLLLSSRDAEQALTTFVPESQIHIAGQNYLTLPEGKFVNYDGGSTREYELFFAERADWYSSKGKKRRNYDTRFQFSNIDSHKTLGGIIDIGYSEGSVIYLRNKGLREAGGIVRQFVDEEKQFDLVYRLNREMISFAFEESVFPRKYAISFVSTVDRTVKDLYKIDENELRLGYGFTLLEKPSSRKHIVLYDSTGNSNAPLREIYRDFEQVIQRAYENILGCNCKNGCYLCMRSYQTHYLSHQVDKEVAKMILGYLLGKGRFIPSIDMSGLESNEIEEEINIIGRRVIHNRIEHRAESMGDEALFDTLLKCLKEYVSQTSRSIRIKCNDKRISSKITGNFDCEKGKQSLERLLLELKRFDYVEVL